MNAFDATRAGGGETGLANIFAALSRPSTGQGPELAPLAAAPFAELLDRLTSAPAQPLAAVMPSGVAASGQDATRAGLGEVPPRQPLHEGRNGLPMATLPDRSPFGGSPLECGLRLPGTGKMLPVAAAGGTILPLEPESDVPQLPATGVSETLPAAELLQEQSSDETSGSPVLVTAQPVTVVLQPAVIIAPAHPMRSIGNGSVRASSPLSTEPAAPVSAEASLKGDPASPAVKLTAADLPVGAGADRPLPQERPSGEVAAAAAPARPALQSAPDMHASSSSAHTIAVAPHARAEPQQAIMQDLTQIVERLAAAREAAVPATTQLAVQHADFGPLSLSIQQGDRGQLEVAVAAVDRDSQVALVAAITQAEAAGFDQATERRGSESAQRDASSAGQQGEHRGQGAQRDRFAGHQQRQPMARPEQPRGEDGETRNGTYA